jgi:hypothetical protein
VVVEVRDASPLLRELEDLKGLTNAHKRGYDFQIFVGRCFQSRNFHVETRARVSEPRQVDVFASRGDEAYLIEAKWRKDLANIDDIDSLFTRLEAVPPSVTGLMVSYEGFTAEVVSRVEQKSVICQS